MDQNPVKNSSNYYSLNVNLSCHTFAIKQLLQQQLFRAINLSGISSQPTDLVSRTKFLPSNIPLHRLTDDAFLIYRSPVALQQAARLQLKTIELANLLIESFQTIDQKNTTNKRLEFRVEVTPPGWINFCLSEQSLSIWLQNATQASLPSEKNGINELYSLTALKDTLSPDQSLSLFKLKYFHARCCSLLRLAQRQVLIKLGQSQGNSSFLQIFEPNPIPWLINHQELEVNQAYLRLKHPAEMCLIFKIIDVQDIVNYQNQIGLLKLGTALCTSFDSFYRSCRIWGEVKTNNPQLSQARLGLVNITQVLLCFILQERLGVSAPMEL